jgi:hypothetical protein
MCNWAFRVLLADDRNNVPRNKGTDKGQRKKVQMIERGRKHTNGRERGREGGRERLDKQKKEGKIEHKKEGEKKNPIKRRLKGQEKEVEQKSCLNKKEVEQRSCPCNDVKESQAGTNETNFFLISVCSRLPCHLDETRPGGQKQ